MRRLVMAFLVLSGLVAGAATAPTPRPPLVILYDELPDMGRAEEVVALRGFPYRIVYQSVDPAAARTGRIDVQALLAGIRRDAKMGLPEWGMLDFEEPFQKALESGPDSPECQATVRNMVEAMRAVREAFPDTKWTYYGMPWLPYWFEGGGDWVSAPETMKRTALERSSRIYGPILASMDWISPTIYPKYDPRMLPSMPAETVREQGRAWRAAQVGVARLHAAGRPIIPNVCPWWTPGGRAKFCTVVLPQEFLEDQVLPAVGMGASGVALWSAAGYTVRMITDPDQAKYAKEANFGTDEWRSAVTADYLGGIAPPDWSSPELRSRLASAFSGTLVRAMSDIRGWERSQEGGGTPTVP